MAVTQKTDQEYASDVASLASVNSYVPSENVTEAQTELAEVSAGKPAEYTNENAEQLQGLYDSLTSRGAYSYDPSTDSAYQQYKTAYQQMAQQGSQAAQDQTKQLSGGYGNTWSQAAGNQQYGEALQSMNDVLPSYEQNAYGAYQADENTLNAQLSAATTKDAADYQKWQDEYNNWYNDRAYAQERAQTAYSNDYQQYTDNISNALTLIGYGRDDAETVRSNAYTWATTLLAQGIMPIDTVLENAGISHADALAYAKENGYTEPGTSSGGHSGSRKSSGSSTSGASGPAGRAHRYIAGKILP